VMKREVGSIDIATSFERDPRSGRGPNDPLPSGLLRFDAEIRAGVAA